MSAAVPRPVWAWMRPSKSINTSSHTFLGMRGVEEPPGMTASRLSQPPRTPPTRQFGFQINIAVLGQIHDNFDWCFLLIFLVLENKVFPLQKFMIKDQLTLMRHNVEWLILRSQILKTFGPNDTTEFTDVKNYKKTLWNSERLNLKMNFHFPETVLSSQVTGSPWKPSSVINIHCNVEGDTITTV